MSDDKRKSTLEKTAEAVAAGAAAGAAAYAGVCWYIFQNAFDSRHASLSGIGQMMRGDETWLNSSAVADEWITSFDGISLHASRVINHRDSHRWVIAVPGYLQSGLSLLQVLHQFDEDGYNLLALDNRASGKSAGIHTGLGWPEHYDLISWINYLINLDHDARIVLYGFGMGGTAVLNATGEYLPRAVRCAIEDGGYSGIREILAEAIRQRWKFSGTAFLRGIDFFVSRQLHFSIYKANTLTLLGQSTTPTLFIHGDSDSTVPSSMMFDCYYACASAKELCSVKGADHACTVNDPLYFKAIGSFLDKYMI